MNYSLTLLINSAEAEKLRELIEADGLDYGSRSEVKIRKDDQALYVDISAYDATSLRATINGVIKVLQVYEKSGSI